MSKYIFQLRRGWKETDVNGKIIRDDWGDYEASKDTNPNYLQPYEGELVLEYDNGIPRLKIGDGKHPFSELPYMSVDSFILPTRTTITLYGGPDYWNPEYDEYNNLIGYTQEVRVTNYVITPYSKVDIQPNPDMLAVFHEKDVTFTAVTETIDGVTKVTVHVVGQMPQDTYSDIQVTVTEVVGNG